MSVATFIAALGLNSEFVAFNAHWGFAFFVMTLAAVLHLPLIPVAIAALALAAFKEFYFDVKYEKDTYIDGLYDFGGYAFGLSLGLWLGHIIQG